MLFSGIKKFIQGGYKFECSDGFSSCFFDELKKNRVTIENVRADDRTVSAECRLFSLHSVKKAASKADMTFVVLKSFGLTGIFSRYKRRLGVPVGLAFAILICIVCSSVIWSVDVSGNEKLATEELIEGLRSIGIYRGCFSHNIECNAAEAELQNIFPDILWCAVNIDGSRIFLNIRERESPPDGTIGVREYSNIIAGFDGEIIKCDVFEGEDAVAVGSAVVKGDMLVSGVKKLQNGGVIFTDSKAEVIARVRSVEYFEIPEKCVAWRVDKSKDRFGIYFFGTQFFWGFAQKEAFCKRNEYLLDAGTTVFPVGFIREHYYSLNEIETVLSSQLRHLMLLYLFASNEAENYNDALTVKRVLTEESSDVGSVLSVERICERDIGIKQTFFVEDAE